MKTLGTSERTLNEVKTAGNSARQLFKAKKLVLDKQASTSSAK
jgi:hypothetical protein